MELTSFTFFAFVVLTAIIYFIIPKKIQWVVLLASSLTFLFWDDLNVKNVICASVILISAYISAIVIDRYKDTDIFYWFCSLVLGDGKSKVKVLTVLVSVLLACRWLPFHCVLKWSCLSAWAWAWVPAC